jgi:hypothetical protein
VAESGVPYELITPRGVMRFNNFISDAPTILGVANGVTNPEGLGGTGGWLSSSGQQSFAPSLVDLLIPSRAKLVMTNNGSPSLTSYAMHADVATTTTADPARSTQVVPGQRTFARGRARWTSVAGTTVTNLQLKLTFYKADLTELTSLVADFGVDEDVWTYADVETITPANAAYAAVAVVITFAAAPTTFTWELSEMQLTPDAHPNGDPEYATGDSPEPYNWVGAPHASQTVRSRRQENDNFMLLTDVSGLSPDTRRTAKPRPHTHGLRTSRGLKGGMHPVLEGAFIHDHPSQQETMRRQLIGAAYSILDSYGTLRWQPSDSGGEWRYVEVQLDERPDVQGGLYKKFIIPLIAEKPFIFGELQEEDTSFLSPSGGGGFTFPFSFSFTFASSGAPNGGVVVHNGGEVDTYPIVRVHGPVTDPILRNDTTGQRVTLTGVTIAGGLYADYDMWEETITRSDGVDLQGFIVTSTSEFFPLVSGDNIIVLSGSATSVTSTHATVYWRNSYA